MLKRKHRLRRALFAALGKQGSAAHSKHLTLRYVLNVSSESRFAVVVSKKVAAKAVERHKMRRRTYEVIQKVVPHLNAPLHAIFFTKPGVTKLPFSALEEEIQALLKEAGVYS